MINGASRTRARLAYREGLSRYLDRMTETPEQAAERRHKYIVRCLTSIQLVLVFIFMATCSTCSRLPANQP